MGRPTTAVIDLNAIQHNYQLAKQAAPKGKAMAIIKADAYGHGAIPVANALKDIADAFGVACIEEAIELREAGISIPILLLEGFFSADELALIGQHDLWCVIHNARQIDVIRQAPLDKPIHVWLKMDSGMHRLGIAPEHYRDAYQTLKSLNQVEEIVLMSHMASADDLSTQTTQQQITCFDNITTDLDAAVSLANSAATMAYESARRGWQRPGIMLYGASPFTENQYIADQLIPAMTLRSEIIAVRELQVGDAVGYGGTWICNKPTRVGTVAIGYADGYPRHAKNGTPVLIDGVRSQIIGRVSMDMITVDLTALPQADIGSTVELWGKNLNPSEVARYCDTIPYTLFTGITRRVHKHYRIAK